MTSLLNRLTPTNTVKLLGVTLDNHFSFGNHFDSISKKCHGSMCLLKRASSHFTKKLLRLAHISLIRSQLEYSSAVFYTASKTLLKKLDIIQKVYLRIIL